MKIGLAVLKSTSSEDSNLLIKRYTLQVEYLFQKIKDNFNKEEHQDLDEDWYFRDAILKCLYSKDIQYPTS
jgi:hypothetical protein